MTAPGFHGKIFLRVVNAVKTRWEVIWHLSLSVLLIIILLSMHTGGNKRTVLFSQPIGSSAKNEIWM